MTAEYVRSKEFARRVPGASGYALAQQRDFPAPWSRPPFDRAAEIVHIGQAIMAQPPPNNSLMYFINTTFNYPTMAEAYRVAALNGLNRVF